MPQDSFSEMTSQSWFGRIGNAVKGVLIGLLLFILAFPLLFWNEGRAVKRHKTLKEGGGAVISVPADRVEPGNEGMLIHVSGLATTGETLSDPELGPSAVALKLRRVVQAYQWREESQSETKKKLGGGTETVTTYTYTTDWSEGLIDSNRFKRPEGHQNPAAVAYASREWEARQATLGAFRLTPALVSMIDAWRPLRVTGPETFPEGLRKSLVITSDWAYLEGDPAAPAVGDLRFSFQAVEPTEVSLVARQIRDTFEPYQAKAGGTIQLLEVGTRSADSMFQAAEQSNRIMTWVLRLIGFLVMAMGLAMVLKPLSVLADVLPFLGDLVGMGTGLAAGLLAGILSLCTVSVAWLFYRPLVAVPLLAVAGGLGFWLVTLARKRRAARTSTEVGAA